jgi:hypothetical protein
MKKIKILVLCLAMVFAVGALMSCSTEAPAAADDTAANAADDTAAVDEPAAADPAPAETEEAPAEPEEPEEEPPADLPGGDEVAASGEPTVYTLEDVEAVQLADADAAAAVKNVSMGSFRTEP